MLIKLLLAYLVFYLSFCQVNAKGRKEEWPEQTGKIRRKTGKTKTHQDQAGPSRPSSSSFNREFSLDLNELPIDLNQLPYEFDVPDEEQDREYSQTNNQDDNVEIPGPELTLPPGDHNLVRLQGKWDEINKNCQTHWKRRRCSRYVITFCDSCEMFLCRQCHKEIHNLPKLPNVIVSQPDVKEQSCFYCNQALGCDAEEITKHTFSCTKIPRRINNMHKPYRYACFKSREACNIQTDNRKHMEEHVLKHTKDRPHKCDECGNKYKHKRALMVHIKTEHPK